MLTFHIGCVPPKSTAQNRTVYRNGGRMIFAKNAKAKQAEGDLLSLLMPFRPDTAYSGPVELDIEIVWPWRKSEPKKNRVSGKRLHDKKPDLDNWAKTFVDCMTKLGYFLDDSQVASLRMRKYWGERPGITVKLSSMETAAA